MKSSDIFAALNEVERRVPVLGWRVGDIHLWPLARVRTFVAAWERANAPADPVGGSRSRVMGLLRRLATSVAAQGAVRASDAAHEDALERPADILFVSDGVSFVEVGGVWHERFCDPLIVAGQDLGHTTLMWTPGDRCLRPRASPSVHIQPRLDAVNALAVARSRFSPPEVALPGLDDALRIMGRAGLPLDRLQPSRLGQDAARLIALRDWYAARLRRVRPRLVAVVGYYGLEMMALVAACRSAGIPTIDLQHGVQGRLHVAYGSWEAVPAEGYALLPDRFWTWTAEDAANIAQWRDGRATTHRPIVGGNPWLDRWLGSDPLVARYDGEVSRVRAQLGGSTAVLVTLQFGYPDSELLDPVLACAAARRDVAWFVRLHPTERTRMAQLESRIDAAGLTNVEVRAATQLPLYALLRGVDAHVTHSSSTVLEAERFGVGSLITSEFGAELHEGPIARGVARLARPGAAGFADALDRCANAKRGRDRATADPRATIAALMSDAGLGIAA